MNFETYAEAILYLYNLKYVAPHAGCPKWTRHYLDKAGHVIWPTSRAVISETADGYHVELEG